MSFGRSPAQLCACPIVGSRTARAQASHSRLIIESPLNERRAMHEGYDQSPHKPFRYSTMLAKNYRGIPTGYQCPTSGQRPTEPCPVRTRQLPRRGYTCLFTLRPGQIRGRSKTSRRSAGSLREPVLCLPGSPYGHAYFHWLSSSEVEAPCYTT
jgi:hypothetical protein